MKNKLIASGLAGLAILGGTVAFAVSGVSSAGADTTESTLTQAQGPAQGLFHNQHRRAIRREVVKVTSETIKITPKDLVTELRSGKSIADVAKAHNVDPQAVIDALVADGNARLDQAVTNGKITQEKADKAKAKLPDRVTKLVNHQFGKKGTQVPTDSTTTAGN